MNELQTIYKRASSSSTLERKENHLYFYDKARNLIYLSRKKMYLKKNVSYCLTFMIR